MVQEQMRITGVEFTPYAKNMNKKFNSHVFDLYVKMKGIKNESEYSYQHIIGNNSPYTYSNKLVERIIQDITDDPDLFIKNKN